MNRDTEIFEQLPDFERGIEIEQPPVKSVTLEEVQTLLRERHKLGSRQGHILTLEQECTLAQAIEKGSAASEWLTDETMELPEEETEVLQKWVKAREESVAEFIASNQGLVTMIAKRYMNRGLPLEDLIQEGNIGLLTAVEKYDWRRGFRFNTMAFWWIRQAIPRKLTLAGNVNIPPRANDLKRQVKRFMADYPTSSQQDAYEFLGLSDSDQESVEAALAMSSLASLNKRVGDDLFGSEQQDFVADSSASVEHMVTDLYMNDEINSLLHTLGEKHRQAIILRFGLGEEQGRSYEAAAEVMGVAASTFKGIVNSALDQLQEKAKQDPDFTPEKKTEPVSMYEISADEAMRMVRQYSELLGYSAQQIASMLDIPLEDVENYLS